MYGLVAAPLPPVQLPFAYRPLEPAIAGFLAMQVTVDIPDDLAERLKRAGGDLSRRALEAFALEEYRRGLLTRSELRRLLGFGTLDALDGFLKAHGIYEDHSLDDLASERRDLKRLEF